MMIRRLAKKLISLAQRRWLDYRLIQLREMLDRGQKYSCNICGNHGNRLAKFNGRTNRLCPTCFLLERHRLLFEYLKNETTLFTSA